MFCSTYCVFVLGVVFCCDAYYISSLVAFYYSHVMLLLYHVIIVWHSVFMCMHIYIYIFKTGVLFVVLSPNMYYTLIVHCMPKYCKCCTKYLLL